MKSHTRPTSEQPILVVGSARSGTSVFAYALRKGAGIRGFNEGHFLSLLPGLLNITGRYYARSTAPADSKAVALAHLPLPLVRSELVRFAFGMMDNLHDGDRWVDKTPGPLPIDVAVAAGEAQLGVRVVFLHRRAIENVVSRLAKFPGYDVAEQAKGWAAIMGHWRRARALLPAGSWIEVEQNDIARRPEDVTARVQQILALTDEQARGMARVLREARRQQLASDEVGRVLTLDETGWSPAEMMAFREIVSGEMTEWGYGWGKDYRAELHRMPGMDAVSEEIERRNVDH